MFVLCECKNDADAFDHVLLSSDVCTSLSGDDVMSAMIPLSVSENKKRMHR